MACFFFSRCFSVQVEKIIALSNVLLATVCGVPLFSHEILKYLEGKVVGGVF